MLSRGDFGHLNWNLISFPIRLSLLKDTLTGLITLHKQGLMHRDITVKNLLLVTLSPPEAALCDFGRTIEAEESMDTAIGPKCTLAPEVWGLCPYNNKVDVWSLAFAWLDTFKPGLPRPDYIDYETHRQIINFIQSLFETKKISEQFAILLRQMLSWDSRERLSSEEALKHPCWKGISNTEQHKNEASPQKASSGKRKSPSFSPERTPSDPDNSDDDHGNGKSWLEFHKEREKQRARPERQTDSLLLRR